MSMVVVHVASGTRDILVFWAAWPRLWAHALQPVRDLVPCAVVIAVAAAVMASF